MKLIQIHIEEKMWEAIKKEAKKRGLSGAGLIRLLVYEFLNKKLEKK